MTTSGRKAGDWNCSDCTHHNFSRREACQRCGRSKAAVSEVGAEFLPGDWLCAACGTHNYACRPKCFKCAASKDGVSGGGGKRVVSGWKSGDWLCTKPGCNKHNFASRMECFSCNTPRSYGSQF